ncbi:hypothetical protein T12_9364 [Trichinella patagoniensis]|uniref:Uncharacterized protein n=1 Tax=Trichinella patagoniensis TaxID=990121 RepID=A0A0V1AET3_9BILA|nr:hypothetical protein T12_9364 [Trichinella patagoniensis]
MAITKLYISQQFSKTLLNHCLNKKLHVNPKHLKISTHINKTSSALTAIATPVNVKEIFTISQSKIPYNKYLLYTFYLPSNELKVLNLKAFLYAYWTQ